MATSKIACVLAGFVGFGVTLIATIGRGQSVPSTPDLPSIPAKTFLITDHGAVTGNSADNAKAVQETIDAASKAGGGIVEVPRGTFLCGPVTLADQIELKLDAGAELMMLPMGRFPVGGRESALIYGRGLHDIAISGEGIIDGQGGAWWPLVKTQARLLRPRMIALSGCDKILIEGVTLRNSPMFHIAISGHSTNVTVRGVTIRAPASTDPVNPSHNTDACDVSGSHVLIENCDVSVGDDNFTCGGGTSDVHIRNCKYGFGHGVSIGSPTNGGVHDITVEDCTFTNTDSGIRIKSDRDRGGTVERLTYRNLKMTNVGFPILIYASYMAPEKQYRDLTNITPAIAKSYPARQMSQRTPLYRDLTFSNITATAAPGSRAGLIWGLPEAPATDIVLENVQITADKPFGIFNAKGIKLEKCRFVVKSGGNGIVTGDAEVNVTQ
jgi:polygalacturonase